ncbi:hypothetical protein BC828DRAFT_377156 [Blastocladiella britannica]|nr:hypothetical protein BC828DRAFT_377156 [Blastocladiella britannica]
MQFFTGTAAAVPLVVIAGALVIGAACALSDTPGSTLALPDEPTSMSSWATGSSAPTTTTALLTMTATAATETSTTPTTTTTTTTTTTRTRKTYVRIGPPPHESPNDQEDDRPPKGSHEGEGVNATDTRNDNSSSNDDLDPVISAILAASGATGGWDNSPSDLNPLPFTSALRPPHPVVWSATPTAINRGKAASPTAGANFAPLPPRSSTNDDQPVSSSADEESAGPAQIGGSAEGGRVLMRSRAVALRPISFVVMMAMVLVLMVAIF